MAKDLEGKIATDSISNEIVHQLRGKISETLIRSLDEKYKEKHRVGNARKQKKKHESTDDLAASVPLNNGDIDVQENKKIIIDTSGNEISGPQPSVIDYDSTTEITASNPRDVANCEQCEIKDTRIRELEEVVIKTTKIAPANEIAEDKDYKIKQLQQELDERTRQLDAVKHFRELQTEVHNHNTANIAVTDFEFSLLLGDIKYHLSALYPRIGDAGKVWFSGKLDKDSGKIHSIRFGRIGEDV